ncbi:MAG: hypothetical protein CL568_06415 [Alphaproteobacteria bacterium]|jgi:dihydrofolate reductase|nr:hypothetical protein [Alphaproteobacteria bacterium]PPR12923.1 MAG: Dihydrofolate reductase type 3 [Alphaproteobacteria bacterium MarineAlpha12_Bin1]|tara:strand:+ start:3550 stop:4047 length:498 start_codon:yes stop_codon:yes gene_type:complete
MPGSVALIAAISRNGVIGKNGKLPWSIPADMKHFRSITMGKPIIMGRNTFESIGSALPGRHNIVVTSKGDYYFEGIEVANSLEQAFSIAETYKTDEIMIIGGEKLYQAAFDFASKIYLTEVDIEVEGDTHFPDFKRSQWKQVSHRTHSGQDGNPSCSFLTLEKIF